VTLSRIQELEARIQRDDEIILMLSGNRSKRGLRLRLVYFGEGTSFKWLAYFA